RKSLEELRAWVNTVQARFAQTPSIWPVHGRISSWFGYRVYPWRGFHYGLDICAPYGTPVRAGASGVVTYVGWQRGYGKTVEISHGYGVSTLYGHLSRFAVANGQRVKKGQIIAYVGLTGWTTGLHLHYGIKKWGQYINPVAYLNLNIMSASRLWNGSF
ncbi:MAG: M23 family metallopeptidase, partial [Candidatus Margulisiibacteriota bacterium]